MEFFRIIKRNTTEENLRKSLVLDNLDEFSSEIFNLESPELNSSSIGGIWGEFTLSRNEIKGGVRFSLVECPNALAWTVTTGYPPAPEAIVVHLTVNREQICSEFTEEIEGFLSDHCDCLSTLLSIEKV